MKQISLPLAALFSAALVGFSIPVVSQADSVARASAGSLGASQSIFDASGDVLQASGEFIVVSATATAEGSIIVIEAAATGVSHTLEFASDVLKGSALVIGTG